MAKVWLYKKPKTTEGLFMVQDGDNVRWARTLNDNISTELEKDTLEGFCQMKSDEGYELDENNYFTFSKNGIHDVYREDPCLSDHLT